MKRPKRKRKLLFGLIPIVTSRLIPRGQIQIRNGSGELLDVFVLPKRIGKSK